MRSASVSVLHAVSRPLLTWMLTHCRIPATRRPAVGSHTLLYGRAPCRYTAALVTAGSVGPLTYDFAWNRGWRRIHIAGNATELPNISCIP